MSRLSRQLLPARPRTAHHGAFASIVSGSVTRNLVAPQNRGMSSTRHLIEALDGLSSAVIDATGRWAFLAVERIQLVDAAHKLAWLLVRVNRNEAMIARAPDLAGTIGATVTAAYQLRAVHRLGDGTAAITALFDLVDRVDGLLPKSLKLHQ